MAILIGILLASMVWSSANAQSPVAGVREPKPFDPPTSDEAQRLLAVVEKEPTLVRALGNRYGALGVALYTEKGRDPPTERLFEVWFYSYERDETIVAIAPDRGTPLGPIRILDSGQQPPLSEREAAHAFERAAAAGLLPPAGMEDDPVVRLVHGPWTPCPVHRCAGIPLGRDEVTFDFSEDRLLEVAG